MANIFINQDFTVILDVSIDISTAPTLKILYRKPNSSVETEVNATLYTNTSIYYDVPAATNNVAGKWLFRAKIIDASAKTLYGEIAGIDVRERWYPYQ